MDGTEFVETLRQSEGWAALVMVRILRRLGLRTSSPNAKVHDETGRKDALKPFWAEATWSVVEPSSLPPRDTPAFPDVMLCAQLGGSKITL